MGSQQKHRNVDMDVAEDEQGFLKGMNTPNGLALHMVLKAACELNLFDLIVKAGRGRLDAQLTATQIASLLSKQLHQNLGGGSVVMLDRMLRFLTSASYFNCEVVTDEEHGDYPKRLYSLAPLSKVLVPGENGVSLAPILLLTSDKVYMDAWGRLKDAILEGGSAFVIAHGMHAFEYPSIDTRFNEVFNNGMIGPASMAINRLLEVYHGFEGVNELVDVGGGFGATAGAIVSKYPNIQAINFDLPHVIQNAPPHKGVKHIAGDMFESIPKAGEVILMKWVLHDWSDDHCIKILSNCYNELPENGKVIVVDTILPECPDGSLLSSVSFLYDIAMMTVNPGGKERTLAEFEFLARKAGFISIKVICRAYNYWVIEFYKK